MAKWSESAASIDEPEDSKFCALIIRLRVSVSALSWVGTASVEHLIFDQRFILNSMSARPL